MIVVGDIAVPTLNHVKKFHQSLQVLQENVGKTDCLIGNLEGLLSSEATLNQRTPLLFNHPQVVEELKKHGFKAICLANNHTNDLPNELDGTLNSFKQNGIETCGAGLNFKQALLPASFTDFKDRRIFLFNFCWSFLLYHQSNPFLGSYVAEIEKHLNTKSIESLKKKDSSCKIVVYFHWSFDFERLPFPVFRRWAHECIDAGADWVVGCHSHCIMGAEAYNGSFIHYGLGNFYIPHKTYVRGTLDYPNFALDELAVEYDFENEPIHHWLRYSKTTSKLEFNQSKIFSEDHTIKSISPFRNMPIRAYHKYYGQNRRKNRLIPIFGYRESSIFYNLKMKVLKSRAKIARLLATVGLRKWNN